MSDKKYLFEFKWEETTLFKRDCCYREWSWIPRIGMWLILNDEDEGFSTKPEYYDESDYEGALPESTSQLAAEVVKIEFYEDMQHGVGEVDIFIITLKPEE